MKILIFVLLFTGFFLLFCKMRALDRLSDLLKQTCSEMDAVSRQRSLADRQKLLQLREKNSLWYTLGQRLQYSGITRKFPGITLEKWLLIQLILVAGIFMLSAMAAGVLPAACVVLLLLAGEEVVLKLLRMRNYRRTENSMTKLLDFLGNYSIVSGEVTGILGQVSRYMEEPIKSALEGCYYDAATTGDSAKALLIMAERLEYPKFKELARNMEISVRYCADFSALVASSRRSLQEYIRASGEKRGLLWEAGINLLLLAIMSMTVLAFVIKLTGGGWS